MAYAATLIDGEWVYATRVKLITYLGLDGITLPAATLAGFDDILVGVSRSIEQDCNRVFYKSDAGTRRYTGEAVVTLRIDDVRSVESVTVDGVEWVEGTDFALAPYTPKDGYPYTELIAFEGRTWISEEAGIVIVGDWGWTSVPREIHLACLARAKRQIDLKRVDLNLKSVSQGDLRIEQDSPENVEKREMFQVAKYRKPLM